MPSLTCRCRETLSYDENTPNPGEWLITPEYTYDTHYGVVYAEVRREDMCRLLKCGACNRVWILWSGPDSGPIPYAMEF